MTIYGQNGKPMQLVAALHTTPIADVKPKEVHLCGDANDAIPVAEFIVGEMKKNPYTAEGKKIAQANRYDPAAENAAWNALPWYAKWGGPPDFYGAAAGHKAAAYEMWAERVAPNRPWDHKPILRHKLEASGKFNVGWQKYGQNDYFYDIWSNIHYGYVGIAIGFSASELIGGAGLAQALSDSINDVRHARWPTMQNHPQNGSWPSSADDIPDHISIQLGIDLYATVKPDALTADLLLRKIAAVPLPWGQGRDHAKRPHQCPR
ncbi:polymorphic toxin type 44 domain-containing protein [Paraburkholderia bannensis]|uniref:polymorphic toxin type 44 domain-containing protein n=1 Tax=Paraburkholderia bannensis TaxID=765414 RepID=UPI002AC32F9B|nr:polymorphic toxin type 44 domain-containing protein [Paraburkholderia bannensis]